MRDCTAHLEEPFGRGVAAQCNRLDPHTLHAGLDSDGEVRMWTDADDGAARG